MTDTNVLIQDGIPRPRRRHPFGVASLALWGIAVLCTALDEAYEPDHIRALTLTADLDRIVIGGGVLCTLLWYLDRHLLGHVTDWRIGVQYGYETGYRDGREGVQDTAPELHLVEPIRTTHANGYDTRQKHHV